MVVALSLISGPFPIVIGVIGFAALASAVSLRARARWWLWPVLLAASVAQIVILARIVPMPAVFGNHFPPSFYLWVALPLFGGAVTVAFWRFLAPWRRLVALLCVPFLLAFAALQINAFYSYIPTVNDLLGRPLPGQVSARALLVPRVALHNVRALPAPSSRDVLHGRSSMTAPVRAGTVAQIDIPATVSRFPHRKAWIWLPPAWVGRARPLPVLVLLAGTPGTPADWFRAGRALQVANAWAATHNGVAPIMVIPDENGSVTGDTECVNRPGQRAETYVAVDVPHFVISVFGASRDPADWAVVGMSEGATCALELGLRHPGVFRGFVDLSGDIAPTIGSFRATLYGLFGGSLALQRDYDPQWLLRRPRCGFAWFDAGTDDHTSLAAATTLSREARRSGLDVVFRIRPGGHNYRVIRHGFAEMYPWLVSQLGARDECRSHIDT